VSTLRLTLAGVPAILPVPNAHDWTKAGGLSEVRSAVGDWFNLYL
jgi:hypothetical protein